MGGNMMKRLNLIVLMFIALVAAAGLAFPEPAQAGNTTVTVVPSAVTDAKGITIGPVSRLATANQSGAQNTPAAYVTLTTPNTVYTAQFSLTAPFGYTNTTVASLTLIANFMGPVSSVQTWSWSLYNWSTKKWVAVGNNAAADGVHWTKLTFTPQGPGDLINPTGQILVQIKSNNDQKDGKLDYLAAQLTLQPGISAGTPIGIPGSWRMVFDDEFSGSSLDLTKWEPNWFGATSTSVTQYVNSLENECYDPANLNEANGELDLNVKAKKCPASAGKSAGKPYTSALIDSHTHFTFTYGVAETRMWVGGSDANHCNNWDAFWLNGLPVSGREEYDVAECLGGLFNFHLNPANIYGGSNTAAISKGWHVFSIDWEPTGATVYYDAVKVGTISKSVYKKPMYIIVQLAIHNSGKVVVPDSMRIDYVRVWQK